MRYDQHCNRARHQLLYRDNYFVGRLRVQSACRFIKQHDLRIHCQRPSNRNTLLLSAGKLCRIIVRFISKPHNIQKFHGFRQNCRLVPLENTQRRDGDILQTCQMREKVKMLEHHSCFGADTPHFFFGGIFRRAFHCVHQHIPINDDAAGRNAFQIVHTAQQCAFAAAGRTDDRHRFPLLHLKGNIVQRCK